MNESPKMLAVALVLAALLLHDGVICQEGEPESGTVAAAKLDVITGTTPSIESAAFVRGDMVDPTPRLMEVDESETVHVQIIVFPTLTVLGDTAQPGGGETTEAGVAPGEDEAARSTAADVAVDPTTAGPAAEQTEGPVFVQTNAPPTLTDQGDVMCVDEEAVMHRDVVSLKLKASSSCEDTRARIQSVLEHLCGVDCKLEIFQRDNSDEIIVAGQYIEDNAKGMAEKFNNDNIKDKIAVEEAVPRWGKHSQTVLVSLLLTGLLLAALLIGGYYLKTHRGQAKGLRLAEESFQVDEENQGNTLVSVAPLHPQEPLEKPTVNGESPEDGKSQPPPTNGHSATQTPVADTEM